MYTLGILSDVGNAIMDGIRTFFLTLCDAIYRLIYFTFYIFEKLGTANILKDGQLEGIFSRVGLIIGIFMIFRVTFAFVQYIVDPDAMTDKNKGMGNIVKKIVIAIVLLGSTTSLFKLAYRVQDLIVDSKVLSKVIFNYDVNDKEDSFGGRLSAEVFSAFYRLNASADTTGNDCEYYFINDDNINLIKQNIMQKNGSLDIAYSCVTERDSNDNYIVEFDGGGFIALVMGAAVLYTIAIFTIQVGVRLVQLAYLQIIAPIPIIMYITPKGDDYLKKWGTQCLTTFLDFFLRTAIIYFAIAMIQNLMEADTLSSILSGGGSASNGWQASYIFVIMVIAILVFAKKVPALLKEIFPSLGGAAAFDYGLSFKKQVVEPLKTAYNSPLGWGLKLGKHLGASALAEYDRVKHNLPLPRNKLQQKIDKLMPGHAEKMKNEFEANKALENRKEQYEFGKKIFNKYGEDLPIEAFNAPEYRMSYETVKKAKKDADKATFQLRSASDILTNARASGNQRAIEEAEKLYEKAYKNDRTAQGALTEAKEKHEKIKVKYEADAKTENSHKYYKDTTSDINFIDESLLRNTNIKNNTNTQQQPRIITEEHVQSRPREETNSNSLRNEYESLINQYNNETDPNKKADIRRQLDDFESGRRG